MIICAILQLFVGLLDAIFAILPAWDWTMDELPDNGGGAEVTMWDQSAVAVANLSPVQTFFLFMARMNKFMPVDQFLLAIQFVGSVVTAILAFRAVRWVINVVRGSGA